MHLWRMGGPEAPGPGPCRFLPALGLQPVLGLQPEGSIHPSLANPQCSARLRPSLG